MKLSPLAAALLSDDLERSFGVPRAPGWKRLRRTWLKEFPNCAVCGTDREVVPHHVVPFHVNPARELDRGNLLTLCPPDHWLVGHLCNWSSHNKDVRRDAARWLRKITSRPR